MKIGTKRMWKLISNEIESTVVNGSPLSCTVYPSEGVEFRYGKKKLFISNDEENLVRTEADCQRLCDRVNRFFTIA